MKIVVGLGNVGPRYALTRHNLGFMVVEKLIADIKLPACTENAKFQAQIVEALVGDQKVLLVKPTTMMNLSGQAVGRLAQFYKVDASDVVVVYDELDLAFGKLRIRRGGGTAGHNGLKSIVAAIGDGFVRYRIGIANDQLRNPIPSDAFVLSEFNESELEQVGEIVDQTAKSLLSHLNDQTVEDTTFNLIG